MGPILLLCPYPSIRQLNLLELLSMLFVPIMLNNLARIKLCSASRNWKVGEAFSSEALVIGLNLSKNSPVQ